MNFINSFGPETIWFLAGWAVCYWSNRLGNRKRNYNVAEKIAGEAPCDSTRCVPIDAITTVHAPNCSAGKTHG